jgi:hypothetical protein
MADVQRVAKLLKSHRVRIARALVRQTRALAPRYEQLDLTAQEHSFLSLLVAVERLLERGEDGPLLDAAAHLAQMRASMGFRVDDFSMASLSFLPVMRRFIVEHAKTTDEGLDDYEAFEAIALPFIGRATSIFLDAAEDPTLPNAAALLRKHIHQPMRPLRIERVTGNEDEESTFRNHPLFSTVA